MADSISKHIKYFNAANIRKNYNIGAKMHIIQKAITAPHINPSKIILLYVFIVVRFK
jgi:hypothetical protein